MKVLGVHGFTDEELRAELEKRKVVKSIHPCRLDPIDWNPLIKMVEECEAKSAADRFEDEDNHHYFYEAMMTAIYGPDYFAWRRKQSW